MGKVWCVVKDKGNCQGQYGFTKWHATKEEAIEEAKRLAEANSNRFLVLEVIGVADRKPNPVEYCETEDEK
jgi:hypothetical protein